MANTDLYYGALIAFVFLSLITVAELLRGKFQLEVEWTRKLVHLGGGIACLCMPFLIESHWVVLALAASMGLIFVVTRRFGWLQSVHAVERKSYGTEYYPIVVYLLFLLSNGTPWKFVISMLVLAVSDSAAAIVGTKFGRVKFAIEKECKSLEGALAFFAATFVLVLIPLFIWNPLGADVPVETWSDGPALHYFLAACLIGLLVMCFELVSLQGRDNLFIPLGTLLVLTKTLQTDASDLIAQNVSFVSILIVIISLATFTNSVNIGGAVVVCLACYGCWAMGSFDWAIPIFFGYGVYLLSMLLTELPWRIKVRPVVYLTVPPMLILAIGNLALNSERPEMTQFCYGPFLVACSLGISQAVVNVFAWRNRRKPNLRFAASLLISGIIYLLLFGIISWRIGSFDWLTGAISLAVVIVVGLLGSRVVPAMPPSEAPRAWLYSRAGISVLGALLIAISQAIGAIGIWPLFEL